MELDHFTCTKIPLMHKLIYTGQTGYNTLLLALITVMVNCVIYHAINRYHNQPIYALTHAHNTNIHVFSWLLHMTNQRCLEKEIHKYFHSASSFLNIVDISSKNKTHSKKIALVVIMKRILCHNCHVSPAHLSMHHGNSCKD